MKRQWTEYEVQYLIEHYATRTCADIAQWVHHPPKSVQMKAFHLGLRKSKAFMAERSKVGQFRKGNRPRNKGRSWGEWMSEEGRRNSTKTQFKPGEVNPNSPTIRQPGYECVRTEKGRQYIWIKPHDGRRMMPKHRYLWELEHGEIPKGFNVQFKDGNPLNCELDNLYLISRAKQVRKNFDDLPTEKKAAAQRKRIEKLRETIARDRIRLKWGFEPKTKLVKRIPR